MHAQLNAIFKESALTHFASSKLCSDEYPMPVWNFMSVKMTDMKSIPVWVSFCLNSCEHKEPADWTTKWGFQPKWNLIPVWAHFDSHVNVPLYRKIRVSKNSFSLTIYAVSSINSTEFLDIQIRAIIRIFIWDTSSEETGLCKMCQWEIDQYWRKSSDTIFWAQKSRFHM